MVNPSQPPWTAIVKVQTNIGSRCTGVLIAPATVLTAAHCLYNPRTRAFLQPVSLHVLFGYQRGEYRWHRLVTRFAVGPGFEGTRGPPTADWARLELTEAAPSAVALVLLAKVIPRPSTLVSLAGYNQDRAQVLLADLACHVIRSMTRADGGTLIMHDCAATRGTIGAPLLMQDGDGWAVLGINLAAGREMNLALAATRIGPLILTKQKTSTPTIRLEIQQLSSQVCARSCSSAMAGLGCLRISRQTNATSPKAFCGPHRTTATT